MSRGDAELFELQEKLELVTIQYDRLNEEWAGKHSVLQDEFQREKYDLLQDCSARLQAAKEDAEAKNVEIVAELDKFRRAFAGDPLGWAAATDEKGDPFYYNSETGESEYDKPRILEIAEVIQNIDALGEGKKMQEKAIKKGKEAELQARKLEILLNKIRTEAAALRQIKKEWEACGAVMTSLCTTMSAAMDEIDARVKEVEKRLPVVDRATKTVNIATERIRQLKLETLERGLKIDEINRHMAAAKVEVAQTRDRANKLEERFIQAVEERVDEVRLPLEDRLAAACAARQEEKALRESDRRYLADLWPEGWLVPSILRRFRTMTPQERAEQTIKMEEVEAERELVEGIRAGVAAAAKWEVKTDDYGRTYYTNWETGEAVYEPPPEMGYHPPLGRNELGMKVDPRLQALREWQQGTDGWGKPFWRNARSGDVVYMEPKGWSEAMGLGEHELEGWKGPTQGEVSKDVAIEAARVVVTWLNKVKEAQEKRARAAAEPTACEAEGGGDKAENSEEEDDDQDEFVYDIQAVEELALGDEGWCYESPAEPSNGEDDGNNNVVCVAHEGNKERETEAPAGVAEIRCTIVRLARHEDRLEARLKQVRRNLEDLAHDLLDAKKAEELEAYGFALGHRSSSEKAEKSQGGEPRKSAVGTAEKVAEEGGGSDPSREGDGTNFASGDVRGSVEDDEGRKIGAGEEGSSDRLVGHSGESVAAATATIGANTVVSSFSFPGGNLKAAGGLSGPLFPDTGDMEERVFAQNVTQAAGEAAVEEASGVSRDSNRSDYEGTMETDNANATELPHVGSVREKAQSSPPLNLRGATRPAQGRLVGVIGRLSKILPESFAQKIGDRAFPTALTSDGQNVEDKEEEKEEEVGQGDGGGVRNGRGAGPSSGGASCAAFHALAAEAMWAGLNGSDRVEMPPADVWKPRGGDRWSIAAFFAEQIGEREDEIYPGLPQQTQLLMQQTNSTSGDNAGGGDSGVGGRTGEKPLPGSSARHAAARALCMAAVSSRRGFLKQAADEAMKEALRRSQKVAENMAATNPVSLRQGEAERSYGNNIAADTCSEGNEESEKAAGEPVIQSAIMLRFGVEVPSSSSAGKSGRTVQIPIPDDWNDPEAQEKRYTAQMARRQEIIAALRARDEALLARPKGYDTNEAGKSKSNTLRRGCQDARELLRYEAVVLEAALHHALVEIHETQSLLEERRVQAAARWKQLIDAEEAVLTKLASEASRRHSETRKQLMGIRGLRVPLIEPQPPPAPTLDPAGMQLPPLVSNAVKMRQDEVDKLEGKIRSGRFDRGEPILLPEGKTLTPKQLEAVAIVVSERRAELAAMLEEEMIRYKEAVSTYEYKHREWERLEVERKEQLAVQCHQSRLDHLDLDGLAVLSTSHKKYLEFLQVEASADESMALQSQAAKRRFEATLAKEIVEETRAHDWLIRLQAELSDALRDKESLERLPDAALNRLDVLRWEKRRGDGMIECRRRVAELREALIEEGRRRRQLYDERKWAAQSELRRVLAERTAVGEKAGMLRLLLKVGDATLVAQRSMLEARKKEAAEDKEGIGTEGPALPGEVYSAGREWISEEFQQADAEHKAWKEKLEEMVKIRMLARRRETTVGELVLGAARGALPPPHPDQWLPKAERQRHEDEVRLLLEGHDRELRAGNEAVEASRAEAREALRDTSILRAKLGAIEGWRDHEILTLRTAGRDAVDSLKGLLEKQRRESAIRIDKLEQALSEIRKEYNEVRSELTARIDQLNRGRSNTEAWVKALRHDLAEERAKRENAEARLAVVTERSKVMHEKLRVELRAERMHSLRLELWIAAMHGEIQRHIKTQEEMRRLQALERLEHEREMREQRHRVWRNRTSVRLLCTSVDSLFLFFAQRVANLAGSRRVHNDALRANGAVEVLAAICRGPRKDTRRLAARALGALGWNGHTEARVLAWDIYRHWDLWVQTCCPAEEERLRRRGLTFDSPEKFRHDDQVTMPAPASAPREEPSGCSNSRITHGEEGLEDTDREPRHEQQGGEDGTSQPLIVGDRAGATNTAFAGEPEKQGEKQGRQEERAEEEADEEFRPKASLSARAVVRERRQWALRRARRLEGPHEANQLELGGGFSAATGGGEAWVETVVEVTTRGGAEGGVKGSGQVNAAGSDGKGGSRQGSGDGGGTERRGEISGAGSVVALLARLCREKDDWEVVRAAAAALSVAAYHEDNADRMGRAAPDLISVLVSLLPHPDSEVQAHAATTLANLAYGSPAYQSDAGEAGAVEALLDVCRGRSAGSDGDDCDGNGGGDGAVVTSLVGVGRREGGQGDGKRVQQRKSPSKSPRRRKGPQNKSKAEDKETLNESSANELGEARTEKEEAGGGEANGKWARKRRDEMQLDTEVSATGDTETVLEQSVTDEGDKILMVSPQREGVAEDQSDGEGGMAESMDVDAVQAATAALANLLCYSEANCVRLVAAGGIGVLVGLVSSYRPQNLVDFDQAEEIQANAAEALVNATRNHGEEVTARVHSLGISPLVLMCGSKNLQVQRHAALVLGNVCQTDAHRATAGAKGAVEGLFVLCEAKDDVVRANALWALGNLAWDPYNQERIGRYTSELLSLVSNSWLPIRTNALICLANSLFFHEPNRRRVEAIDGALLDLLRYCEGRHPTPVQEAALRCLVSLTYVDRIVAPLVGAGCISTFVLNLAPSVPAAVRHPAALALLNVSVHDLYKSRVADAGGVEAAVALLGSDNPEERELAARILEALACTEVDDEDQGRKQQLGLPQLLGIVQMHGNLTAQKAAAEKVAQEVSKNPQKQRSLGDYGGLSVLLDLCDPTNNTEPPLLVPVLWGLRNSLHGNGPNKDRFLRAGGPETLIKLCQTSRSTGEWAVAEGVLTTLVTAALGNEKICRRLLRVGLDQLIDAAEDGGGGANSRSPGGKAHQGSSGHKNTLGGGVKDAREDRFKTKKPSASTMPGSAPTPTSPRSPPPVAGQPPRGPATDRELGLDQIDEIGVDGVLRRGSDEVSLRMQGDSRETCSALATSLLQTLGPFNYVICGHCGAREKGGTSCSQCGYPIKFDFSGHDDEPTHPARRTATTNRGRPPVAQGS